MAKGPEALLVTKMRNAGHAKYLDRLVMVKYHGSQFGEAGVSDLLCCIDGQFVAVEVKTKTGKVTVKQAAFGNRIMRAGGTFAVCRTVEEFLETLDAAAKPVVTWNHDDGSPCNLPDTVEETLRGVFTCDHVRLVRKYEQDAASTTEWRHMGDGTVCDEQVYEEGNSPGEFFCSHDKSVQKYIS